MRKIICLLAVACLASSCASVPRHGREAVALGLERFYTTDTDILGRPAWVFDAGGNGLVFLTTSKPDLTPVRDHPNGFPSGWTRCDFPWIATNNPDLLLEPIQRSIIESKIEPDKSSGYGESQLSVLLRGKPRELVGVIHEYFIRYAHCPPNYTPHFISYAAEEESLRRSGRASKDVLDKVFPEEEE